MRHRDIAHEACSIARPLSILGDRWTLMILRQAFRGVRRFEEFQASLGLSRPLLTDRLARLVDAGVLARHPYKDIRTRHEYHLTEKGHDLFPVLQALRTWGDKHLAPDGPLLIYRHQGCTGRAEIHLTCSDCGAELTNRDIQREAGPGQAHLAA